MICRASIAILKFISAWKLGNYFKIEPFRYLITLEYFSVYEHLFSTYYSYIIYIWYLQFKYFNDTIIHGKKNTSLLFIFPLQNNFLIFYFLFLEPKTQTEENTVTTDIEVQTVPATPDVLVPTIDVEEAGPERASSEDSNQSPDPTLDLDSPYNISPRLLDLLDQSFQRG